jgi:hypothetical protein
MSINKSKNAKGERRKVEEKLENLETQKWRNKGRPPARDATPA